MTSARADYRLDIDGLRGIAVLAVVAFHFDKNWLPGGFSGVDIFFVISGYVVTASLFRSDLGSWWTFLADFYSRRARRILPALLLCLATTAALIALFVPPEQASLMHGATFAAAFGFSNLFFGFRDQDYFGLDQAFNPLTHTWSLGVEEQFYLLFPLFLLVIGFRRRSALRTSVTLLGLTLLSAALFVLLNTTHPAWAFYLMPARLWELSSGALLLVVSRTALPIPTRLLGVLSLPLLAASCLIGPSQPGSPISGAALAVAGTLAFIGSGGASAANRLVANPVLVHMGRISYSLYLWHWPVLILMRWTLGTEAPHTQLLAAAMMYAFALGSAVWIERPVRRWQQSPRVVIWGSFSSAVVVASLTIALTGPFHGALFLDKPALEQLPKAWWPQPCHANRFEERQLAECLDPMGSAEPDLVLIGDSHAGNFWPVLESGESESSYRLSGLTMGAGCAFAHPAIVSPAGEYSTRCAAYNDSVWKRLIEDVGPGDMVAVGIDRAKFSGEVASFVESTPRDRDILIEQARRVAEEYRAYLETFARALDESGASLVLLGDVPALARDPRACPPVWWQPPDALGACGIDRSLSAQHASPVEEVLASLADTAPNVMYWNPHDLLCDNDVCLPRLDGAAIFADAGHISMTGAAVLASHFEPWLRHRMRSALRVSSR